MDVATFTDWSVWFAWGIVRAAVLTIPVFVLAVLLTGLGRRWLAPWGRWSIWSLVLVRLLMPVSIGEPAQPAAISGKRLVGGGEGGARSVELRRTQHDKAKPAVPRQPVVLDATPPNGRLPSPMPAGDARFAMAGWIALVVLLAGMACAALWTLITTVRLHRWLRGGTDCHHEDWLQMLAEDGRSSGSPVRSSFASCHDSEAPRPAAGCARRSSFQRTCSTGPPLRSDTFSGTNWLISDGGTWPPRAGLTVVRILHWWNPVFWWTQRCWLLERELACDAMVLRHLGRGDALGTGRRCCEWSSTSSIDRGQSRPRPGIRLLSRTETGGSPSSDRAAAIRGSGDERKRWIARGTIACLALVSLTDLVRAQPAPVRASIALPAGTIWAPVPRRSVPDIAHESREYDLAPSIDRVWQDEPTATRGR